MLFSDEFRRRFSSCRRNAATRRSPNKKLIWYPDENVFDGPSADDGSLRSKLETHFPELSTARTRDREVSDTVAQRLSDMGYRQ